LPPAAARSRAAGTAATTASWPQIALPMVNAPNITVTCMGRPRPRTHPGKATCAEMSRLDTAAIQEAPAMKLATIAVTGWQARANNAVASAVPRLAIATRESAPNFSPSRRKRNAPLTADSRQSESSEKPAWAPPSAGLLKVLGDLRHQAESQRAWLPSCDRARRPARGSIQPPAAKQRSGSAHA